MTTLPNARTYLGGLVGKKLATITQGRTNVVLEVRADEVLVATRRSPQGRPVRIREIESAFRRLSHDGELEISVQSVGYRSAFIGAVLASLPGVEVATRPRRVRL